ncbi:lysine--tRNA ligase [Calditrichota bacterium]
MSEQATPQPEAQETDLNHVMTARREKLAAIKEHGINPFPYSYIRTHKIADIQADFESIAENSTEVSVAGRILSIRLMGKAAFCDLQDEADNIQLYFKKNIIGDDAWDLFKLLDIGDIIGLEGTLFITRTGERSIEVHKLTLLTKNLRPLPAVKETGDKVYNRWDDKEERYRKRTIDLILNRDSRDVFVARSKIVSEIRHFLGEHDFLEVETPVLQPLYGGAAARPFTTFYNALDRDLYLRIADELYLKRLIAGGLNRVYEIAKDFRNEGVDRMHSPEFTMLEWYAAYEDYNFNMELFENMMHSIMDNIFPGKELTWNDKPIDLNRKFTRATMAGLVMEHAGVDIIGRDRDELANEVRELGIEVTPRMGVGKMIDELFSEKVEPTLHNPTFVMDYPVELSPLAKRHRDDPRLVERFELFMGGMEVANAFSELNDPIDQRARFEDQARLLKDGDDEAAPVDEDFLETLEIGMPPTAGLGTGIDRLTMLLTGASAIRDVILFPALRPKS